MYDNMSFEQILALPPLGEGLHPYTVQWLEERVAWGGLSELPETAGGKTWGHHRSFPQGKRVVTLTTVWLGVKEGVVYHITPTRDGGFRRGDPLCALGVARVISAWCERTPTKDGGDARHADRYRKGWEAQNHPFRPVTSPPAAWGQENAAALVGPLTGPDSEWAQIARRALAEEQGLLAEEWRRVKALGDALLRAVEVGEVTATQAHNLLRDTTWSLSRAQVSDPLALRFCGEPGGASLQALRARIPSSPGKVMKGQGGWSQTGGRDEGSDSFSAFNSAWGDEVD